MMPGKTPPKGFALLGTSTLKIHTSCSGDDCLELKEIAVNIFVKQ
jgi:hypothetical protein